MRANLFVVILLTMLGAVGCLSVASSAQPSTASPRAASASVTQTSKPSPAATATNTPSPSPTAARASTPSPTATAKPIILSAATGPVPPLIVRGSSRKPQIAITFDSGAGAGATAQVLDILRDNHIHSTFFVTGQWAEANPALVKRIVAEGHKIANHSYSHPDFTTISDDKIASELARTEEIVKRIAGVSTKPYFRPPFGAYDNRVLRAVGREGYTSIYWTVDGTDWRDDSTVDSVIRWVMKNVDAGSIVIHHSAPDKTAKALPEIIRQVRAKGLQIVNLSDLLGD